MGHIVVHTLVGSKNSAEKPVGLVFDNQSRGTSTRHIAFAATVAVDWEQTMADTMEIQIERHQRFPGKHLDRLAAVVVVYSDYYYYYQAYNDVDDDERWPHLAAELVVVHAMALW